MGDLVLSLFPGLDVLGMGFEAEGFCVVRGPDVLLGTDVREFTPQAGKFDGVIGGPPCQAFSPIGNVNKARYGEASVMPDLIPEFARVVSRAEPAWWVMENSPHAYAPMPSSCVALDTAWLGERQSRKRNFWSSHHLEPEVPALIGPDAGSEPTVCSSGSVDWKGSRAKAPARSVGDMLELQGLPRGLLDAAPFTVQAKKRLVGNAVPLPMARAIARAVRKATV